MNIIKYVNVGGRLKSTANSENPANDHVVAGANAIFDDEKALLQSNINKYLYNALETICEQLGIELPNNGGNNNPGDNPSTPDNPDNPNPGGNTPIPENLQEILNGLNQAIEDLNTSLNSNSGDLEGLDDRVTEIEEILSDTQLENEQAEQEEYVDLGLPSGTLWAKYNVGASRETECGNYYTYGSGINTYDSSQSSYYLGAENPLPISVDTAAQSWGTQWRTPTKEQFEELLANTTCDIVTIDGIEGIKLTANNGKYLFFPGSGWWSGSNYMGADDFSYYWSSTPYDDNTNAYIMSLTQSHEVRGSFRGNGFNIRPVLQYTIPARLVEIDSSGKLKKSDKKTTDFVQTTQNCKILVIEEEEYNSLESYDKDTLYFVLKPWEEWTFGNDFPAILQ